MLSLTLWSVSMADDAVIDTGMRISEIEVEEGHDLWGGLIETTCTPLTPGLRALGLFRGGPAHDLAPC